MLQYVHETHSALTRVLTESAQSSAAFAGQFAAKPRRRVVLVGSGTSFNACVTAKFFVERMLGHPVETITAYAFANFDASANADDIVVAVTQEGESTNTIAALNRANDLGIDTAVVTEEKDNTCSRIADVVIPLVCGPEDLGPKTKGYTATVLTIMLAAIEAAKHMGRIDEAAYNNYISRIAATVDNIPHVIEQSIQWFETNRKAFIEMQQCYMLGYGANAGTVEEGALKSLETVRLTYLSFEIEEFLHGPVASLRPEVHTIVLASEGEPGFERAQLLYGALDDQTPHAYFIGGSAPTSGSVLGGCFIDDPDFSPLEYCIPLQLLAYFTYTAKGMDLEVRNYPKTKEVLATKAN